MKCAKKMAPFFADRLVRSGLMLGASLLVLTAAFSASAQQPAPIVVPVAVQPAVTPDQQIPAVVPSVVPPAPTADATVPPPPALANAPVVAAAPGVVVPAEAAPAVIAPVAANAIAVPELKDIQGAPASLGSVIHDLQASSNNITVNDMARAQDALARLDLLVSIQKKVGELRKAQDEASGVDSLPGLGMPGAAPTAIPASALNLPTNPAPVTAAVATPVVKSTHKAEEEDSSGKYKVQTVAGANGNLSAMLDTPDGDQKTVRVGDHLGKYEVVNISAEGVKLRTEKGATKTISIENNGLALAPFAR